MADSDFALFNDILDDIATKTQEDEDEAFFGVKLNKQDEKHTSLEKKKDHPTVQFAPSPLLNNDAEIHDEKDQQQTSDKDKESENDISSDYKNESNESSSFEKENNVKNENITRQDSQSSIDDDIKESHNNLIESGEQNENEINNEIDNNSGKDESEPSDSDNESERKTDRDKPDDMNSYRESSDSISNIDLESYRPNEKKEIKTVSFSMQYDKFCNVLNRIETGMTGGSVSFDVDAVTNENKLLVSPMSDNQSQFQPLTEQPPAPIKRKKRKVKKKRKKSASVSNDLKEKPSELEQKCFCRTCKYSIYNQPNTQPVNHMFKSNSQPPTPPTPMIKKTIRPKTTSALKSSKRNDQKMIDLDFGSQRQRTSSKLDADLKKSGNPVLIAWLKVKNDEEKERKRRERKEIKKQEKLAQEKLLKMRQRNFAATERVQEWINRKRVQSVELRKQISAESYKSVPSEPFDYSDEKFESGFSSEEDEKNKGVSLPQIFPSNRPKTSRGPQNRQQKRQKPNLISVSPAGKNITQNRNHVRTPVKDESFNMQTDDSGLAQDETTSVSSKDFAEEKKRAIESSSESESEHDYENQSNDKAKEESKTSDSETDQDERTNTDVSTDGEDDKHSTYEEKAESNNTVDNLETSNGKPGSTETPEKSEADNIQPEYVNRKDEDISEAKNSNDNNDASNVSLIEPNIEAQTENVASNEANFEVKYVLDVHDTQIKFDSVRDFTDLIIHDAVEEMEINSRIKEKRLRRQTGKSSKNVDSTENITTFPPKSSNQNDSQEQNEKKQSRESSFNSVKDLVNYEKILVNGKSSSDAPSHQAIENSNQTNQNVNPTKEHKGKVEKKSTYVSHDDWISQKKQESKEKKKREKALNDFYNELEMKIVQEEKVRRVMEKEASKKRVDSGMHHKKPHNNVKSPKSNGAFSYKYNGLSQQENLLKFGRMNEFK